MESPLPSLEEQKKIVSFLDEKLALIDSVLQKKEKQIELLREKRSALISQAVTKGLDPETKLVDSGIKWIGKMPIEWGKANLGKILSYVQPGAYIAESIEEEDGDNKVPVLTANKGFTVGYTRDTAGIFNNPLPVIIFDDFTTSKKFVTEPFKVRSSALKILKLNGETEADLRFVYRCMEVLDFFVLEHNRHWIAMYRKEFIPFPSLRTQREIADYLDEKDRLYKKAINLIESSIISLEELRSSLISHAVTGNIKI
jgi:type I restriction enzyme S subunit